MVGSQLIAYNGRSTTSGEGTLNNVPASGSGSIGAPISAGATAVSAARLTGVTGIVYPLLDGDNINLYVQVNDLTAQAALAALTGGDGIHEEVESLSNATLEEATNYATAQVTIKKDARVDISYSTRDPKTATGKVISVDLNYPAVVGSFLITQATINNFHSAIYPVFTVQATNSKFTLENILLGLLKGD
jgi:hypothetical protein